MKRKLLTAILALFLPLVSVMTGLSQISVFCNQ